MRETDVCVMTKAAHCRPEPEGNELLAGQIDDLWGENVSVMETKRNDWSSNSLLFRYSRSMAKEKNEQFKRGLSKSAGK